MRRTRAQLARVAAQMTAALVAQALLASGCSVAGTGQLSGTLFVERCDRDGNDFGAAAAPASFSLPGDYFIGESVLDPDRNSPRNRLTLKMLSSKRRAELADLLIVRIADVGELARSVGQPVSLGPATNARAALVLRSTCPEATVELELDGDAAAGRGITFSRLGQAVGGDVPKDFVVGFGERVTASIDVDVIDRRAIALGTPIAAAGALTGSLDFTLEPDATARAYP